MRGDGDSGRPLAIRPRARRILLAIYIGLLGFLPAAFPWRAESSPDWILWRSLPDALASGQLYATGTEAPFVWSPLAAVAMQFVWPLFWPWLVAHFAVLPLLRDWRMVALVLLSFGFWTSTWSGSPFIFVFVAAVLAHRGSRPAALVYIGLTLLIPRPLQLPLVAWLLWRMPEVRLPAALLFIVNAGLVLASGYALEWIAAVGAHAVVEGNYAPTRIVGPGLMLIGIPLGLWLLWRGRPGLAGLAVSPYWLPEYLMFALLDLVPGSEPEERPVDQARMEGLLRGHACPPVPTPHAVTMPEPRSPPRGLPLGRGVQGRHARRAVQVQGSTGARDGIGR